MTWRIDTVVGPVVTLVIDADPARIVLQSIPPFTGSSPAQVATGAVLVGASLELTFPAAPDPGTLIQLESAQPGVRSNLGAYLAAGAALTPVPVPVPPAVTELPWTIGVVIGSAISLDFTGGPQLLTLASPSLFTTDAPGSFATEVKVTNLAVEVTFSVAPLTGDSITVADAGLTNGSAGLLVLQPDTQVVP